MCVFICTHIYIYMHINEVLLHYSGKTLVARQLFWPVSLLPSPFFFLLRYVMVCIINADLYVLVSLVCCDCHDTV